MTANHIGSLGLSKMNAEQACSVLQGVDKSLLDGRTVISAFKKMTKYLRCSDSPYRLARRLNALERMDFGFKDQIQKVISAVEVFLSNKEDRNGYVNYMNPGYL